MSASKKKNFFWCWINVLSWIHGGDDSLYAVRPPQLCSSWSGHQSRRLRCNCCKGIKVNKGDWNRIFCQKMSFPRSEKGSGKLMVLHWLYCTDWPLTNSTGLVDYATLYCALLRRVLVCLPPCESCVCWQNKSLSLKEKKGFSYISCACVYK